MSLSLPLINTYIRCKHQTESFLGWLCSEARATGTVEDLFHQIPTTKPRLKQKRRRKWTYKVPVNAFIRLADAVVNHIDGREVPTHVLEELRDVIYARKRCSIWYEENGSREEVGSDGRLEGHRHIIQVLESVSTILEPWQTRKNLQDSCTSKEEALRWKNSYEALEVEECRDHVESNLTVPVNDSRKQQPNLYTLDDPAEDDLPFAIWCLFVDMHEMRVLVRRQWMDFKTGRLTLATVATVMNTAIGISKRINDSFQESHPGPHGSDYERLVEILVESPESVAKRGNIPRSEPTDADGSAASAEERQITCLGGLVLAHAHLMVPQTTLFTYENNLDERFTSVEIRMLRCLSLLMTVALRERVEKIPQEGRLVDSVFAQDELMNALVQIHISTAPTKEHLERPAEWKPKLPPWTIFAIQIYIDMHAELKDDVDHCFDIYRAHSVRIAVSQFTFLRARGPNTQNYDLFMEETEMLKRRFSVDMAQEYLSREFHCNRQPHPHKWGDFYLLKNHPMLCGILLQNSVALLHRRATHIVQQSGLAVCAAHLYQAARLTGSLLPNQKWTDLDFLLDGYCRTNDHGLFRLGIPMSLDDLATSLTTSLGFPAGLLSVDRARVVASRKSFSVNRRLSCMSLYAGLLVKEQKSENARSKDQRLGGALEPSVMLAQLVTTHSKIPDQKTPATSSRAISTSCSPSPAKSLGQFTGILKAEELALNFDVLTLHERIRDLLRSIQINALAKRVSYLSSEHTSYSDLINVSMELLKHVIIYGVFPLDEGRSLRELISREGDREYRRAMECVEENPIQNGTDTVTSNPS